MCVCVCVCVCVCCVCGRLFTCSLISGPKSKPSIPLITALRCLLQRSGDAVMSVVLWALSRAASRFSDWVCFVFLIVPDSFFFSLQRADSTIVLLFYYFYCYQIPFFLIATRRFGDCVIIDCTRLLFFSLKIPLLNSVFCCAFFFDCTRLPFFLSFF